MPSEVMDQKGGSASSHCFEERQIGFWKTNVMSDHQASTDGMFPMSGSKLVASSPMEKLSPIGFPSMEWMELQQSTLAKDDMKKPVIGGKEVNSLSESSWDSVNHQAKSWSNLHMQPASYGLSGSRTVMNGIQSESSLFSSSLSDVFSKKLKLVGSDAVSHQPFNVVDSHLREEEPIESLKDIEALTIGNLLPDEEDLLSGVLDVLGDNGTDNGDELEDFDLFSSGGGMELEGDDRLWMGRKSSDIANGSIVGEHPYGELPSRTLFVRNINSNVEDSELKALFGHYGDIRTIYTACKHRGFVMISYYDIRAARNALRALQNKPLRRRKLDIHYSIPKDNPSEKDASQGTLVIINVDPSVSTEELRQIFGVYGEIKEIRENPQKRGHKFIEFYDTRAAEAALHALSRSDITGKQIKLEPSRLGGMRRFFQLSDQEQDEPNICPSPFDNLSSGHMAVSPGVIGSSSMDNGSIHTLHSAIRPPAPAFTEPHQRPIIANNLPSLARLTSNGKQFPFNESNHSLDEVKFGNQHASFHPHSLPEYHDGLMEGLENRHVRGVGSNGHLREPSAGVFGSPGNGNYSLHGNHYMWTNSNSHQQSPSNGVWPNSPSYLNGLHPHRIPQMSGFPRVPPLVLSTASPVHHHIGSAPAVNPSLWERQRNFTAGSPETSNFHLGSLGNVGFPGRSPSHPMDIASRNMFSPVGGIDMAKNIGIQSPQQMCHLFPGRNPMMSMPGSFDSPNDRARNLSYRRNELGSSNADKKQYELDLDRILRGEDSRTTLMIKNIPNKYTSKMLLAAIDEHCRGTYDFIYLPIDFKNKCNVGYAFINMIEPRQIIPFYQAFNGKKWEKFNSEKVASLAYARIQGKAALIAHFQNSSLMNEDKRCRPILFHTDGPNAGDPEPFPMGTNIRSRPGKSRTSSGPEENQRPVNTLGSLNGEESSNGSDSSGSLKESEALTK